MDELHDSDSPHGDHSSAKADFVVKKDADYYLKDFEAALSTAGRGIILFKLIAIPLVPLIALIYGVFARSLYFTLLGAAGIFVVGLAILLITSSSTETENSDFERQS